MMVSLIVFGNHHKRDDGDYQSLLCRAPKSKEKVQAVTVCMIAVKFASFYCKNNRDVCNDVKGTIFPSNNSNNDSNDHSNGNITPAILLREFLPRDCLGKMLLKSS